MTRQSPRCVDGFFPLSSLLWQGRLLLLYQYTDSTQHVLDVLAEMIASDPSINPLGGEPAAPRFTPADLAGMAGIPNVGLD
jgi:hypothetical protein